MGIPALDSARAGVVYLGQVPKDKRPELVTVSMDDVLHFGHGTESGWPPLPLNFGHGLTFSSNGWGMDGNGPADQRTAIPSGYAARNGCGDCVPASHTHATRQDTKLVTGRGAKISDWTTVQQYGELTGYDPKTGAGDNGTDPREALQRYQQQGWRADDGTRYKGGAIIELEPGNTEHLYYAAWLAERVFVAFQFQQAQMDQFDAGQPWAYVPGSTIEGGHQVLVDSRTGVITWGRRIPYDASWYEHLNQESFACIGVDAFNKVTGQDAEGYKQVDVERYVHAFFAGGGLRV